MVAGNLVNKIIAYKQGEMTPEDTISFFADLIASGDAWRLQGHYGRTAASLIESGIIDINGKILKDVDEL